MLNTGQSTCEKELGLGLGLGHQPNMDVVEKEFDPTVNADLNVEQK